MKKPLQLLTLAVLCTGIVQAQCTTASINWDNLDFLKQDATYISAAKAQTQVFALGNNTLTINHTYTGTSNGGETAVHTAHNLSNGQGDDVQFIGDGTITLSFKTPVENVMFSLYDIDVNQKVSITALNGTISQSITTLTKIGTSTLIIAGSGTTTASATGPAGYIDNTTDGTANIAITGPVTSVTLNITGSGTNSTIKGNKETINEDGSFFLSDISACTNAPAFPLNYYAVSKPFTGQPGYVLSAVDNKVLMIDPTSGKSKLLFTDPSGKNINSMGYDPYNKFLYYTYSLTALDGQGKAAPNANNRAIQKYNVNTGAITTVVADVTTLGIPTYESGVESGGAAFYDGAFYIGIEGEVGEESKIWRIDFDASFNPLSPARQVFAVLTDNHDWSDFAISNGVLYDFNGKTSGSTNIGDITHINMQTGGTNIKYSYSQLGFVPRQVAVDWTGKLYNTGTAATSSAGTIVPYANGAVTTAQQYSITVGGVAPSGSWGDAAEAFRPMADFGDAPASFDPDPAAPAMHEIDANLRLGSSTDVEWTKPSVLGTNADADGADENGLPYVTLLSQNAGTYYTQVQVFNNTGANATLVAWVDFNNNKVFESGEGLLKTVTTSTVLQAIDLSWTGIGSTPAAGTNVYLRIRITSAVNNMTTANSSGYFANGEVEDYLVPVSYSTLPLNVTTFNATKLSEEKVQVSWNVVDEEEGAQYQVQRSTDEISWITFAQKAAVAANPKNSYKVTDEGMQNPLVYYRLKFSSPAGAPRYSQIKSVQFAVSTRIELYPNPAKSRVGVKLNADNEGLAQVTVLDFRGQVMHTQTAPVTKGLNNLWIEASSLTAGIYSVRIRVSNHEYTKQLIITR